MTYKNPVIRGYHPDPSICRVGKDFYMVTSTFEFFPGVPIFHSKNLVNWELISYCLTDEEQLPLEGCRPSGGIFAPTIRYHDGIFYMITTNITGGGNFIVHTRDIRGKWSTPAWVDQPGIDPSLLFDGGKVYFTGTGFENGRQVIHLFQVDPMTGERLENPVAISEGCGGICPEAPHLYRIGEYYYLMLAEGGTEYGHMVTIQRSKSPYGPYEPCPHNPILTHRHLNSPIKATGHADIVEDQNGNWWLVCLGIRPLPHNMLHNIGRETFLTPMIWRDGWPIVGNGGTIAMEMDGPLPAGVEPVSFDFEDYFSEDRFHLRWNWLRNPKMNNYTLRSQGGVALTGSDITLSTPDASPTWLGIRQPEIHAEAQAEFIVNPVEGQRSGLTAYYADGYHYGAYITKEGDQVYACLTLRVHNIEQTFHRLLPDYQDSIAFKAVADERAYHFYYKTAEEWVLLGSGLAAGLCTEATWQMTFTGTYFALFSERGEAICTRFAMNAYEYDENKMRRL